MLDIRYIIENKQILKKSCKERGVNLSVDALVKEYDKFKDFKKRLDKLRQNRNNLTNEISVAKKQNKPIRSIIKKSKENNEAIKKLEVKYEKARKTHNDMMYMVPNVLHKDVPLTREDRVDWKSNIKNPDFPFKPKTNWEILLDLNLADFKRGIKAAGGRSWILKHDAARLARAITNFILDFWREKGYLELIPPFFVNEENLYITGHYPGGEDEVYKTEDGKVFVATGEISVLAIFKNDTFNKKEMPKKYMCYTPCFRREAGNHADDKGIYRTHQFDKVELTLITTRENEEKEYNKLFEDLKELYNLIKIPFRIITHRAGDMPSKAMLEKDVELWLEAEKRWGEAGSIGMTGSFQARRGRIKYIGEGKEEFAHTIYATGGVANRIFIAIINNYQNKDGTITVPTALIPYMNGIKVIKKA